MERRPLDPLLGLLQLHSLGGLHFRPLLLGEEGALLVHLKNQLGALWPCQSSSPVRGLKGLAAEIKCNITGGRIITSAARWVNIIRPVYAMMAIPVKRLFRLRHHTGGGHTPTRHRKQPFALLLAKIPQDDLLDILAGHLGQTRSELLHSLGRKLAASINAPIQKSVLLVMRQLADLIGHVLRQIPVLKFLLKSRHSQIGFNRLDPGQF